MHVLWSLRIRQLLRSSLAHKYSKLISIMYHLANKVAIVTGGANGIGAGIVEQFVKENVKFIAILDTDETSGRKLEKRIASNHGHHKARFFKCDVTNDDELHGIFDKITEEFGSIDVVVNNAGIFDETLATYKKEIAVNFTALVSSTLKALQLMRVDHGGEGGTIINVSSATALTQRATMPFLYAATKSAVLQFSNCMGMEGYYKHTNVRIITVCFGVTDTQFFETGNSYDEFNRESMINIQNYTRNANLLQSAELAARGVVQSYKEGRTGSTWLISAGQTYDISDNIDQAYRIMSKNVKF